MLIGIDVGTTSVKATLFDMKGHALKSFNQAHDTMRPVAGFAEQDPGDWMQAVQAALHTLSEGVKPGTIVAVGLCSQVNTHVFVGADGKPLMPAITWQDSRATAEAAALDQQIGMEEKITWWGAPLPIDASHVLARIAYVQRVHPDIWKRTQLVMAPKDYCLFHLTGAVVTDPMTSFGLIDKNLHKLTRLTDLVEGAAQCLPPLQRFTDVIGTIKPGWPCAGVPMVCGAMDAWSGLLGAGVSRNGEALYLSGTSEILGIVSDRKVPVPGVIAFPRCEDIVFHAGPTQSGGASLAWLARILGRTAAEVAQFASQADLTQQLPMFLPHLDGERAPLWDTSSRGAFSSLSSATSAAELARSVMEGVGYSARLVFDSLETSASLRPEIINHSGGGSASDLWCQIRADILQRPLQRTATRDAGVLGAALMAGTGTGCFASLADAARNFVRMDRTFEPDASEQQRHEYRFAAYSQLYAQLKPLNAMAHGRAAR